MGDSQLGWFQDRRSAQRKNTTLRVYISGEQWTGRGTARDVSRNGVFVETDLRGTKLGTLIDLTFVLRKLEFIKLFRYSAVVVRNANGGLGLKFCWAPRLDRLTKQDPVH